MHKDEELEGAIVALEVGRPAERGKHRLRQKVEKDGDTREQEVQGERQGVGRVDSFACPHVGGREVGDLTEERLAVQG